MAQNQGSSRSGYPVTKRIKKDQSETKYKTYNKFQQLNEIIERPKDVFIWIVCFFHSKTCKNINFLFSKWEINNLYINIRSQ